MLYLLLRASRRRANDTESTFGITWLVVTYAMIGVVVFVLSHLAPLR